MRWERQDLRHHHAKTSQNYLHLLPLIVCLSSSPVIPQRNSQVSLFCCPNTSPLTEALTHHYLCYPYSHHCQVCPLSLLVPLLHCLHFQSLSKPMMLMLLSF